MITFPVYKKVSKNEFATFLLDYPRPLNHNCSGIPEPPMDIYVDGGRVVAKISRDWMGPNGEIDGGIPGKFWEYYVIDEESEGRIPIEISEGNSFTVTPDKDIALLPRL